MALSVPALMVKLPVAVNPFCRVHPPPEPLKVTLLKLLLPLVMVLPVVVALKVTVLLPAVNVPPVCDQLPAISNVADGAINVPADKVRFPLTVKAPDVVHEPVPLKVRLL